MLFSLLRSLLIVGVLGAGATLLSPEPAQANDGYWKNYWSWYDGNYRPYYNNQYRNYYRNYDRYYGNRYPNYRHNYYRPNYGYSPYDYDRYRPRNTVQFGDFRFSWR